MQSGEKKYADFTHPGSDGNVGKKSLLLVTHPVRDETLNEHPNDMPGWALIFFLPMLNGSGIKCRKYRLIFLALNAGGDKTC